MTETLQDAGQMPPPPQHRRLERDPNDQMIVGVCAAFGRYTGTDPVIWRIALAVLTVFGGAGVVIYAIGWLFIPRVGHPGSKAERLLARPLFRPTGRKLNIVMAAVLAVALLAIVRHRAGPALSLVIVGGVFFLIVRHLDDRRALGVEDTPPGAHVAPQPAAAAGLAPQPPPPLAKPTSRLAQITLSVAAIVCGILVALRLSGTHMLTAPRIVAVALLIVGGGLVVGTWVGRARWLIALASLLALAIAPSALAEDAASGGVGNRTWIPTAANASTSYTLGVGVAKLDLTAFPKAVGGPIFADVKVGRIVVVVPSTRRVHIIAHIGLGAITIFGDEHGGTKVDQTITVGPATAPLQELDLRVGMGNLEVRHDQSQP